MSNDNVAPGDGAGPESTPAAGGAPGQPGDPQGQPGYTAGPAADLPTHPGFAAAPPPQPGYPQGQFGYPQGQPGYPMVPGQPPPQRGFSAGAKIGLGAVVGVVAHIMLAVLGFGGMWEDVSNAIGSESGFAPVFGSFALIGVVGIALLFAKATRGWGIGILIIVSGVWITILGPCLAILGGFYGL